MNQLPPRSAVDAVLFDAGLTLLHPVNTVEKIYVQYAETSGIPLDTLVTEVRRHFGELFAQARQDMAAGADGYAASDEADYEMWRRLCHQVAERVPGLTDDPQGWFESLYAHFGDPETWRMYDDVETTLDGLADQGLQLGVVSNWDSRLLGILEGLGLAARMGAVMVSARVGARKPGPRIFELAVEALGVEPGRTLMVGDSLTDDVEGARGAGLIGVLLQRDDTPPPADVIAIRSLAELLSLPEG
jgi:putative hydrolase of the HAD superfamily